MKSVLLHFTGDGFAQACLVDGSLANRGRCPTTGFRKSARGYKDLEESSALKSIVGRPSTSALKTVLTTQSIANGRQRTQQLVKQVLLGCWSMGLHTDDVSEHAYNWFRVRNLSQLYFFADYLPFRDRFCTKMEEKGEGMLVS